METSQNLPGSEGAYGEAGKGLFIRATGQGEWVQAERGET